MRFSWLVTGAQGFVGRYVCDYLLRTRSETSVLGVGRSKPLDGHFSHMISGPHGPVPAPFPLEIPDPAAYRDRYRYYRADVTSIAEVQPLLERFRPGKIIHLASGLRGDPRRDLLHVNVEGTASLLEAIGKVKKYSPKFVMGSSGGVYGPASPDKLPLSESLPCEPADEYSVTKLASELIARVWARKLGLTLVIARIFNIIGPGQDERHVAGQIALQLSRLRSGSSHSLQIGSLDSTRDFVDVRDVARALVGLAEDEPAEGVFNVGTGVECSIGELLHRFFAISGIDAAVEQRQDIQAGVPRNYADISRLGQIGFAPAHSLSHSVDAVWSYYERLWPAAHIPKVMLTVV